MENSNIIIINNLKDKNMLLEEMLYIQKENIKLLRELHYAKEALWKANEEINDLQSDLAKERHDAYHKG